MKMKKNEGVADRVIRVVVAIALALAARYWTSGPASVVLYVLSVVALFTAVTGFCGLYALLGWSTRKAPSTPPVPTEGPKV